MRKNIRDERMINHIVRFIEQEADAQLFLEDEEQKCIVVRGYLRLIKLKRLMRLRLKLYQVFLKLQPCLRGVT